MNRRTESTSSPEHNNGHSSPDVEEVSQTVQNAISDFISAGEKVAQEYPTIQQQMLTACKQANDACMYDCLISRSTLSMRV